jgi:peptidoglycan/xylan/chitin deacetylase (PgdA/CDA1 family)
MAGKRGHELRWLENKVMTSSMLAQIIFLLAAGRPAVTVVFRFDDYSAVSETSAEVRIIDAFASRGLPLTMGVIPYARATGLCDGMPLPREKAAILLQNRRTVDVAMHGYAHEKTGPWTEFAGVDVAEQVERLRRGKQLLDSLLDEQTTIFIPPWNSYDRGTLHAVQTLGFTCLSAGEDGPAANGPIRFLPATCELTGLEKAVRKARHHGSGNLIIVVLFHGYDFKEVDRHRGSTTFERFYALLDWVAARDDVAVRSIGDLLHDGTDLSLERYAANRRLAQLSIPLPPRVVRLFDLEKRVYLPIDAALVFPARRRQYAAALLFYGLSGTGMALLNATAIAASRQRCWPALIAKSPYIAVFLLAGVVLYTCRDLMIGYFSMLSVSAALGGGLGIFLGKRLLRRTASRAN